MARLGVDYETVKQAAVKLLSQGAAPSVQKIREMLGTGSNTTIAEHLKIWRDEYAQKTIHHLPATMPKELISSIEVLWQTAMEQAQNQLAAYKQSLESEHEVLQQTQRETEKNAAGLKQKMTEVSANLEKEKAEKQQLNTELVLANDRLEKKDEFLVTQKKHYEDRLKHLYAEKDGVIMHNHQLQNEVKILQEKLILQAEEQKKLFSQQRALQEQSETRWLKLIDQAKQETKEERKKLENTRHYSEEQIKKVEHKLTDAQQNIYEKNTQLKVALEQVNRLTNELRTLEAENIKNKSIIAKYENKLLLKNASSLHKRTTKSSSALRDIEIDHKYSDSSDVST
jgi:chromosome segregation ATPase